jgi:hypothetical protein
MILLAAGVAIAPQFFRGNSCGHDFDFHLVSWLDAQNAWRQGVAYPHWTPSPNYGAGEPRFAFYSPLTWMLAAALGMVLPWALVPVALTFLLLAGTGLAGRALARQVLDDLPATLAGCAALFSGYALFTAYERTDFAELAGGFWIPLVLLFALRETKGRGADSVRGAAARSGWRLALDGSAVPLAIAVAGSWLSNPTVGVMACYPLAAVALTAALLLRSWAPVLRATVGVVLGMGLAGIYLAPAIWEQRWVDIHAVLGDPGQTLGNNWLFARHSDPAMEFHDVVLHQASLIVVGMVAVALGGLLVCWLRGRLKGWQRWWIPFSVLCVALFMAQFQFSAPLWHRLPELLFLQFPWRWLVVLEAPMGVLLIKAIWPGKAARPWQRMAVAGACGLVFVGMTVLAGMVFWQSCDDEDSVAGMLNRYRAGEGFGGQDEYQPIGADNSLIATNLPFSCLVSAPDTVLGKGPGGDIPPEWDANQGSCEATFEPSSYPGSAKFEHLRISAVMPQAGFLVLRLETFPAWRVTVNGQPAEAAPARDDGLMIVPVVQGPLKLAIDWVTTPDVVAGRWLSLVALLFVTALCLLERKLWRAHL